MLSAKLKSNLNWLTPHQIDAILAEATLKAKRNIAARRAKSEETSSNTRMYLEYAQDPVGFGRVVLKDDFAPDIVKVMESVRDYPVTVAQSSNAYGKCVAYGEQIHLTTGKTVNAETLIGKTFTVWSVDANLHTKCSVAFATDNGVKPVYRVTTDSGKEIIRTGNHPLYVADLDDCGLSPFKWKRVDELSAGDCLLSVEWQNGKPILGERERVRSVELLGEMPTVAITVPGDETFLTQFVEHNTHCAARIAVWFYKCHQGSQVYTAAAPPEDNLKRLLWGEIGAVLRRNPSVFAGDASNVMHISRGPNEFITGVTIPAAGTPEQREARFSGKHAPFILFIFDEGDAIPAEIYRAVEGGMSGGHARMLIMFNPRAPRGPVYQMVKTGQANVVELNAFNHPNVITGQDLFPGAVRRDTTITRVNTMTRPLAPGEVFDEKYCFKVTDYPYLIGEVSVGKDGTPFPPLPATPRKIIEASFNYVVLGKYPPSSDNQLISEEWTDAARARWDLWVARYGENPPQSVRGIGGLDVAEEGGDMNALVWRYGGWVSQFTLWNGIDVIATGDKAMSYYRTVNPSLFITDATGLGAGVAPYMRRKLGKLEGQIVGCKVSEKATEKPIAPDGETIMGDFASMRDQLWWSVREWLRTDPAAMLPPDQELIDELLTPTYEVEKMVKVMKREKIIEMIGRSPDKASALALTFYPARTFQLRVVHRR